MAGTHLRLHRGSGQGYVLLGEPGNRRRHYVGAYWTDETEKDVNPATVQEARRVLGEHALGATPTAEALTVQELGKRFMADVQERYASRPSRIPHYAMSMRLLDGFAGTIPAKDFGPLRLRAFRAHIVSMRRKDGETSRYNRQSVNEHVQRVCLAFRFGVSVELLDESVHVALATVDALVRHQDPSLREGKSVEAAPLENVRRVLPFLSAQLAAVVQLMLLTAARPSELLALRPKDITQTGDDWIAMPTQHKNLHRGDGRRIPLSAAAMEVLAPFIADRLPTAYLFSPAEAERDRHQRRTDARTTPKGLGHSPGDSQRTREGREALRAPGERYSAGSFRQAVHQACDRAKVDRFNPYQLRHTAGTLVEAEMDELHSGAVLGDRDPRAAAKYHESRQLDVRAREASRVLEQAITAALKEAR